MKNSDPISDIFRQINRFVPDRKQQDVMALYNQVGDRIASAVRVFVAYSHAAIIPASVSLAGRPETYIPQYYMRPILESFFPMIAYYNNDNALEFVEQTREFMEYEAETLSRLESGILPKLIETYADFPDLVHALEFTRDFLPHSNNWKEIVRGYLSPREVYDLFHEMGSLMSSEAEMGIDYRQPLEKDDVLKTLTQIKNIAGMRMADDKLALFLPAGPA